ncbi:uncharacterized protein [Solanum lycopersicum]|uniref:uncharacterized protein n=1 Tax=Solanum lycopersicum TaxID=4081 RepID=UPI003749CF16
MAQAMTTQAQVATIQSQAMTAQANREVAPRVYQQVSTMASRLRDFTRINPPTFYGSKVDEDPHEFLDEVYKVLYSTGVSSSEKAMLALYKLKDVAETWAEKERAKQISRDAKRARSFDGGSSKNRLDIQDKPKFKKRGSSQVPTKFLNASGDRVSNPKFKKGKSSNSPKEKPTCGTCGKNHYGESLRGWIIALVVARVVTK